MGEWTVSNRGRPYHNLAIDEAHESIINLRLKELTSRPSLFRTVQLADFMAYLYRIIEGFQNFNNQNCKVTTPSQKRFICQRSTIIEEMLQEKTLFDQQDSQRQLSNIFSNKPKLLDSMTIKDLLTFPVIGKSRMISFV